MTSLSVALGLWTPDYLVIPSIHDSTQYLNRIVRQYGTSCVQGNLIDKIYLAEFVRLVWCVNFSMYPPSYISSLSYLQFCSILILFITISRMALGSLTSTNQRQSRSLEYPGCGYPMFGSDILEQLNCTKCRIKWY